MVDESFINLRLIKGGVMGLMDVHQPTSDLGPIVRERAKKDRVFRFYDFLRHLVGKKTKNRFFGQRPPRTIWITSFSSRSDCLFVRNWVKLVICILQQVAVAHLLQ